MVPNAKPQCRSGGSIGQEHGESRCGEEQYATKTILQLLVEFVEPWGGLAGRIECHRAARRCGDIRTLVEGAAELERPTIATPTCQPWTFDGTSAPASTCTNQRKCRSLATMAERHIIQVLPASEEGRGHEESNERYGQCCQRFPQGLMPSDDYGQRHRPHCCSAWAAMASAAGRTEPNACCLNAH